MPEKKSEVNPRPSVPLDLPAGIKLVRTLRGHTYRIPRHHQVAEQLRASLQPLHGLG